MSSKLSSLLVQDGVVSVKRMEEAFQRQVIYGGALGTVLLEMGALDEITLIRYLSVTSSLTPADLSELDCSSIAAETKVFPQKLSEKYHVVPVRHEGNLLHVIVTESADRRHLEELSFMLGVTLNAFVVPEVRLYEFMERVYGIKVPLRYGGLLKRLGPPPPLRPHGIPATVLTAGPLPAGEGVDAREPAPSTGTLIGIGVRASLEETEDQSGPFLAEAAPLGAEEEAGREKAPSSGTLMGLGVTVERRPAEPTEGSEAEPASADQDAGVGADEPAAEDRSAPAEMEEKVVQPMEDGGPAAQDDVDRVVADTLVGIPTSMPLEEPASAPHSLQEPARQITGEIEVRSRRAPDRAAHAEPSVQVEASALAPPPKPEPALEPATPSVDTSPIEPAEAAAALAQAGRRDQIFEIFLRGASSRCSYVALFVVFGDHAVGKLALDRGHAEADAISQVEIPLNAASLFRTVVQTGSHYFGPVNDEGLNFAVLTQMDRLEAPNVLVLPVTLKNRVVCMLYADHGDELLEPGAVTEIVPIAYNVSNAFQRLILQSKRERFEAAEDHDAAKIARPEPTQVRAKSTATMQAASWSPAHKADEHRFAPRDGSAQPDAVALDADSLNTMVDQLGRGGDEGERAASTLQNAGHAGLAAVVRRFPGPLVVDRFSQQGAVPLASQHGPLLGFLVRAGQVSVPHLLPLLDATDPDVRYYAALTFKELRSTEAIPQLYQRLFDEQPQVRKVAVEALKVFTSGGILDGILSRLRGIVQTGEPFYRTCAADALGSLRDVLSVPLLIDLSDDPSQQVAESAQRALLLITKHAFGNDKASWRDWWRLNSKRHRIEWMIEALVHQDVECRFVAAQELSNMTGQTFGYSFDLPPDDRSDIHQMWLKWWESEGIHRFVQP